MKEVTILVVGRETRAVEWHRDNIQMWRYNPELTMPVYGTPNMLTTYEQIESPVHHYRIASHNGVKDYYIAFEWEMKEVFDTLLKCKTDEIKYELDTEKRKNKAYFDEVSVTRKAVQDVAWFNSLGLWGRLLVALKGGI